MNVMPLAAEWERIDLLGACLAAYRRGVEVPEEVGKRLEQVQRNVNTFRSQDPWNSLQRNYGLDTLDQDIIACCLAPEAEPRLGWMYQELQNGMTTPYPTPALIREMFVLNHEESKQFSHRLSQDSALIRSGMVEPEEQGMFQPIRPSSLACQQFLGWQLENKINVTGAVQVPCEASWDDLVLPESCLRKLREFILWVTHRQQVEQQWRARVSGGPVALFSGSSGTGKTFAAEVVANTLGFPLYRVDLGLLVSKYIGETEKNLNALFEAADGQQLVLLFDEADSLFSKRGEVREARDRYANMEVSHLLSRIERHKGPCILTSNLRKHIDSAFTRRFQMVIDFPRPEIDARTRLWELHIPPGAPRDTDIDTRLLGQEFTLSGGQIRNAALHAAFLAAGDEKPIGNSHIAHAVWSEFCKKGGEQSSAGMGKFASFLKQEHNK